MRVLLCEWHNSVLYDEQGRVEAMFSVAQDVTERRQAMDQLRDADLRKDVFIATLAHELRNPLAPIANAASLLQAKQLPPERIAWLASMIGRQGARMAHLLDDLLDVSRISRGKVELRKQVLDLRALVREALQTSAPLIEAGCHQLEADLPAEAVWGRWGRSSCSSCCSGSILPRPPRLARSSPARPADPGCRRRLLAAASCCPSECGRS